MNEEAKYLFMMIWNKDSHNLGLNQVVDIDHADSAHILIKPGQDKSTPGILMSRVEFACGQTYRISIDGYTNSTKKVFLWGWVIEKDGSHTPIIRKRTIFVRDCDDPEPEFCVTFCYLAGEDCLNSECQCNTRNQVQLGLLFDNPEANFDELLLRRFELQEL